MIKSAPTLLLLLTTLLLSTSCGTDHPRQEIKTSSLSGFIEGGSATGIYGKSGVRITNDSLWMKNWQITRLIESLNLVRDTTLTTSYSTTDFFTIQIANTDSLSQRDFVDSLIVELTRKQLLK